MKVSTRLTLGFGVAAVLGVAIACFGALTMRALNQDIEDLATDRMVKVTLFSDVMDNFNEVGRSARNILLSDDPAVHAAERKLIADARSRNTALLAQLDKTVKLPKGREHLRLIVENRGPYNAALDQAIERSAKGDKAGTSELMLGTVRQLQAVIFKATDDSRDIEQDIANTLAKHADGTVKTAMFAMAALALLAAVAGALVGWMVNRQLRRALGAEPASLSAAISRVADGDLSQELPVERGDTDSVMACVARMQRQLSSVVGSVRHGSDSVATASAQIAQGNLDLSGRTEQQASALQQTAASMEELGTTVRQNTDNAKQANQLAMSASAVATKGGEVVNQVVDTMKGINDSSRKIADIITVIDGIAFQTNILALNAAVEAARAGEQGRGFAVVAGEVRNLAQRSAEAAKEIKTLITASVDRVDEGTQLVDRAGATMEEIVSSIKRVTDIMGEISSASVQQSAGVAQVGQAVQQMDQATQQNAALVEQSAAAAENLKQQAQVLVQAVGVFKLAGGDSLYAGAALARTRHVPAPAPRSAPARSAAAPRSGENKPAAAEDSAMAASATADWETF